MKFKAIVETVCVGDSVQEIGLEYVIPINYRVSAYGFVGDITFTIQSLDEYEIGDILEIEVKKNGEQTKET